ncbi:hypothetical protein GCM10023187_06780 [Nibrella viscosa]|uniref:ASCH domain-containing protein n=2 Tax=Nibrella viscosa TaxID=1084524 RepID=A0ABP8JXA4_9BACT
MKDSRPYDFVEMIENAPADIGPRRGLIFKDPLPRLQDPSFVASTGMKLQATAVGVCELSSAKLMNLPSTYPADGEPYSYRVWGKLYHDRDAQPFGMIPILYVYVDRIEKVK